MMPWNFTQSMTDLYSKFFLKISDNFLGSMAISVECCFLFVAEREIKCKKSDVMFHLSSSYIAPNCQHFSSEKQD